MIAISLAAKNARLTALRDLIDQGSGTAKLQLFGGTRPAPGGAVSGPIAEAAIGVPAGTVANGELTLALPDQVLALATGTITWFRIVNRNGDWVLDGDVGETNADLIVTPAQVYAGGTISFTSKKLREP